MLEASIPVSYGKTGTISRITSRRQKNNFTSVYNEETTYVKKT